jgi:hypothetical protein
MGKLWGRFSEWERTATSPGVVSSRVPRAMTSSRGWVVVVTVGMMACVAVGSAAPQVCAKFGAEGEQVCADEL